MRDFISKLFALPLMLALLAMAACSGSTVVTLTATPSLDPFIENFDTYPAFITQLQTELNGTTLATGMTAIGQYTVSTFAFSATSMTIFLND